MTIKEEILYAVSVLVRNEIQKQSKNKDVISVVTAVNGDKYKVNIDGTDHWLKDGIGLGLTVGTQVWVRVVGSNMYIASKR